MIIASLLRTSVKPISKMSLSSMRICPSVASAIQKNDRARYSYTTPLSKHSFQGNIVEYAKKIGRLGGPIFGYQHLKHHLTAHIAFFIVAKRHDARKLLGSIGKSPFSSESVVFPSITTLS